MTRLLWIAPAIWLLSTIIWLLQERHDIAAIHFAACVANAIAAWAIRKEGK